MYQCRNFVNADRCGLFFVDGDELWFRIEEEEMVIRIPRNSGIAGHCATVGDTLNIPDASRDPRFNSDVDRKTGYTTNTILCVPIKSAQGNIVCVVQMINKMEQKKRQDLRGLTMKEARKKMIPTQMGHTTWMSEGLKEMSGASFKVRKDFPQFTRADEENLLSFATKVSDALELISYHERKRKNGKKEMEPFEVMQFERVLGVLEAEARHIYKERRNSVSKNPDDDDTVSPLLRSAASKEMSEIEKLSAQLERAARMTSKA